MPETPDHTTPPPVTDQDANWAFEGFHVALRTPDTTADTTNNAAESLDTCWMILCLNGDLQVSVTGAEQGQHDELCLSAGNCLLHYAPDSCTCGRCARKQRAQLLEISCSAETLHRLIGDTTLGQNLEQAMSSRHPMHVHRPMTPAIRQALAALRDTIRTRQTGSAPLVISKALEMVWHFTHSGGTDINADIPPETMRMLQRARTILEENIDDPPDLETLATQVGMSLSRLKLLFPQAYGIPPYGLLRRIRLDKAMHLLSEQGYRVTEAALEVGFTNISHFSKIFVEHFGVKPSHARKPRRKDA